MIITTGNEVTERQIVKYLGIVRGIVVRSPTIGQGLMGNRPLPFPLGLRRFNKSRLTTRFLVVVEGRQAPPCQGS